MLQLISVHCQNVEYELNKLQRHYDRRRICDSTLIQNCYTSWLSCIRFDLRFDRQHPWIATFFTTSLTNKEKDHYIIFLLSDTFPRPLPSPQTSHLPSPLQSLPVFWARAEASCSSLLVVPYQASDQIMKHGVWQSNQAATTKCRESFQPSVCLPKTNEAGRGTGLHQGTACRR